MTAPAEPGVVSAEPLNPFGNLAPAAAPLPTDGAPTVAGGATSKRSRGPAVFVITALLAVGGAIAAAFYFWPRDGGGDVASGGSAAIPPKIEPAPPQPAPPQPAPPDPSPVPPDPAVDPTPPVVTDVDPPSRSPARPPERGGPPPEVEPAPDTPGISADGAEGARQALDAFVVADSVDERLKFVQAPASVTAQMNRYYDKHPLEIQPTSIEFKLSGEVPGGDRLFHVFQMTTAAQPEPFPVSVEETDAGPKVDWMAFIQFHDNRLGKFIKIPQLEADTFYAIVERRHYFRSDVPDLGSKICLGIQPPIPGYEGYAFVDRESALGAELYEKFQWEHMYFPVLKLQWKRTQDGAQYIEVKELVRESWRADG